MRIDQWLRWKRVQVMRPLYHLRDIWNAPFAIRIVSQDVSGLEDELHDTNSYVDALMTKNEMAKRERPASEAPKK